MAVYIDTQRDWGWKLGASCHMAADTLDELHAFARRIGLRRTWFQDGKYPHYDLTARRREAAIAAGAVELDARSFIETVRRIRGLD